MASKYSNSATNTDILTAEFDSSASIRRASVPQGIVSTRLDHFKTLAADHAASPHDAGSHNEHARQG